MFLKDRDRESRGPPVLQRHSGADFGIEFSQMIYRLGGLLFGLLSCWWFSWFALLLESMSWLGMGAPVSWVLGLDGAALHLFAVSWFQATSQGASFWELAICGHRRSLEKFYIHGSFSLTAPK